MTGSTLGMPESTLGTNKASFSNNAPKHDMTESIHSSHDENSFGIAPEIHTYKKPMSDLNLLARILAVGAVLGLIAFVGITIYKNVTEQEPSGITTSTTGLVIPTSTQGLGVIDKDNIITIDPEMLDEINDIFNAHASSHLIEIPTREGVQYITLQDAINLVAELDYNRDLALRNELGLSTSTTE